eukprot:gene17143-22657_t
MTDSVGKELINDPILLDIENRKRKLQGILDDDSNNSSESRANEITNVNSSNSSSNNNDSLEKEVASHTEKVDNYHSESYKSKWHQYLDVTTQRYYYYNEFTKQTQWERPSNESDIIDMSVSQTSTFDSSLNSYFSATFNGKTGAFSGVSADSYWAKAGIADDRAGRQMSAFFDVNSLDANRQEAVQKKKALANSNIDWKKYKAEKKTMKIKRRTQWLRED